MINPPTVTNRARDLRCDGSIGSRSNGIINQFIAAPLVIAPIVSINIGDEIFVFSSSALSIGELFDEFSNAVIVRRVEYAAVRAVARKNMIRVIKLTGLKREISRIMSLE